MLHLRRLGAARHRALTVSGQTLESSSTRGNSPNAARRCARVLRERDGIDPDDVIMVAGGRASARSDADGVFPDGNLAPEGAVIKSTAIDPKAWSAPTASTARGPGEGVPHRTAAIAAIKSDAFTPAMCSC